MSCLRNSAASDPDSYWNCNENRVSVIRLRNSGEAVFRCDSNLNYGDNYGDNAETNPAIFARLPLARTYRAADPVTYSLVSP